MSRISQTFIDDLLNRVDIVDVIDARVKLKKSGKNYSACCPFHKEKTPSFSVSPDKQFYYCFGCGATGNALGFIMDYERLGFIDAVESLSRTAGLEVQREEPENGKRQQSAFKQRDLYQTLEKAATHYQKQLKTHPHNNQAIQYLKNRGLTGSIAKQFGIGFAPPGWDNLLIALATDEQTKKSLIDSGLVIHKEEERRLYDRFRHRITFPIRDTRGRTIGFGGRVLENDKPKYLNSPETPVFQKSRELYGLYEARKSHNQLDKLLVVEGYMDVISLAQYDITYAVATLGTACGEDHLKLAFRYTSEIIFCFDGDNAGRNAAKRALTNSLSSMQDGRQIKFLFLPEGQDPDTLVRQIGKDRFASLTQAAIPLEEFLFDTTAEGIDIQSMDGRARFCKLSAPLLAQLPQGVYRELMFTNLAKRTGLSPDVIMELTKEKPTLLQVHPTDKTTDQDDAATLKQGRSTLAPEDNQAAHSATPELEQTGETNTLNNTLYQHKDQPEKQSAAPPLFEPARKPSSISLSPIKTAMALLLDNTDLLNKCTIQLEEAETHDAALKQLYDLIDYIRKRPNCTFHSLLGFWGGTYGIDAQQELANLVANQFMGSAKNQHTYDALKELEDSFAKLNEQILSQKKHQELAKLKAIGLSNLSNEQKTRFRELIR